MSTAGDSPAATDSRPAELNDNLQELSDAPTQTSSYVLEPYPPEASNQSARGSGHQSASVSNGLSLTSRSSLSLSSPADDTPPHINPIAGPAQLPNDPSTNLTRLSSNATAGSAAPPSSSTSSPNSNNTSSRLAMRYRWWAQFITGVLWLGAALLLLQWNFQGKILGASLCRSKGCSLDVLADDYISKSMKLDDTDRDILGALQVVAKVMEVFWIFLAANLIYDLMVLISRREGLPLGGLMTPATFPDILKIDNRPLFPRTRSSAGGTGTSTSYLWILFAIALVHCIIASFMSSASAVLTLPTLQWVDISSLPGGTFERLALADPPIAMAIAPNCNSTELAKGHYACTKSTYAAALDSAIAHQVAGDSQHSQRQAGFYPGLSREGQVTYFLNLTDSQTGFLWNANRQVLEEFSYWLEHYIPDRVHDSINALVHRMGPTTGVYSYCLIGNISVIPADGGDIHCLVTNTTTHSCTRKLRGRNPIDMRSQFSIQDLKSSNGNVSVEAFSVDQHSLLHTNTCSTLHSNTSEGQINKSCDWDTIFTKNHVNSTFPNRNILVLEYDVPDYSKSVPDKRAWCGFAMRENRSLYTFDLSPYSNTPRLVQIELGGVKPGNETSVVHPDWVLAGWSVDRNDTVDGERYAARELVTSLKNALQQSKSGKEETDKRKHLSLINVQIISQALSMVNYFNSTNPANTTHPDLRTYVTIRVWKYGLSSAAPKIAAATLLLGCVTVLIRLYFLLTSYETQPSVPDIIVAISELQRSDVLQGVPKDERQHVRVVIGSSNASGRVSIRAFGMGPYS